MKYEHGFMVKRLKIRKVSQRH